MHRRNLIRTILATAGLLLSASLASPHAGMEHVMGVVTAITETSVTVDTVQHKEVTVLLDPTTKFAHADAKADRTGLKVGDRVVIHAKLNNDKKLVGVIVQWGTNNAVHSDHMDPK